MKSKLLPLLILLSVSQCLTTSNNRHQRNYAETLSSILNDLVGVVFTAKIPDQKIKPLLTRSISRINNSTLTIQVNDNIKRDIFEGAQFSFKDHGIAPTVSVSPLIIDIYEKHPTLVYSILIHELMHADSFFTDRDRFIIVKDNPNERYLYELDAYHMEAFFLTTYIIPSKKYELTEFEAFLAHSFQKDNLSNFSFSLLGYDMDLVFHLNSIVNSKRTKQAKLQAIMDVTNRILEMDLNHSSDKWENYQSIVPLYTIVQLLTQIVRDVESYHATEQSIQKNQNFNLKESHPEFFFRLNELNKRFQDNAESFNYYYDIREKFKQL